jgi:SAM-dependent methyltransferase
VINEVLHKRYADVLRDHQPVVDIGCGRGELLELLAREGIEVIGVEPDPGMAAEARARGITVHEQLAGDYFATVPDGTLGSVISTHVVEHLPLDVLVQFLEDSARALRPGGIFVAETPNPATLIVLGSHFIMDPTHEWPLHPDLLVFLCESAGFREVRAEFYSPADTMHLPLGAGGDGEDSALARRVDEGFARLNHVLFGPQDYAVFATVGGRPAVEAAPDQVS